MRREAAQRMGILVALDRLLEALAELRACCPVGRG